jgi:hypothetical protein
MKFIFHSSTIICYSEQEEIWSFWRLHAGEQEEIMSLLKLELKFEEEEKDVEFRESAPQFCFRSL